MTVNSLSSCPVMSWCINLFLPSFLFFLVFWLMNLIWNWSLLCRAHLHPSSPLLAFSPFFFSSHHSAFNIYWPIYSNRINGNGNREDRKRKLEKKKADRDDQVDHLIHRKWTEPHKASFLCELAAVSGAAVEKALLIWIKQGLLFKVPLLWVNLVNRPKPFFFLYFPSGSFCSLYFSPLLVK